MPDPRWLDRAAAAAYLSLRTEALDRLVRAGQLPAPSYALGSRSPRWDRHALDASFDGGAHSTDPNAAVKAAADAIAHPNRPPHPGRRHRENLQLQAQKARRA